MERRELGGKSEANPNDEHSIDSWVDSKEEQNHTQEFQANNCEKPKKNRREILLRKIHQEIALKEKFS